MSDYLLESAPQGPRFDALHSAGGEVRLARREQPAAHRHWLRLRRSCSSRVSASVYCHGRRMPSLRIVLCPAMRRHRQSRHRMTVMVSTKNRNAAEWRQYECRHVWRSMQISTETAPADRFIRTRQPEIRYTAACPKAARLQRFRWHWRYGCKSDLLMLQVAA